MKKLTTATSNAIQRWWAGGTPVLQSGLSWNDMSNGGTGIAPIRNITPLPAGLTEALALATAGLAAGTIDPCLPDLCDSVP